MASSEISTVWLEEVDSTNAEARRRAQAGEDGPLWIAARRQTHGRGRRGRVWETAPGNLAATLLLTTQKPLDECAQLAFVAALAAADFASRYVDPALVRLKWPNDPLVAGEKLGGVLIETGKHPYRGVWAAIGVGLNLASAPEAAMYPATCLARHGKAPTPQVALKDLAADFAARHGAWLADGFASTAAAWRGKAAGLGEPCTVRLPEETLVGVAEDLENDGALRLRLPDRSVRRIAAGDVFPASAA